jgi:predicted secreted hydrolase
MPPRRAGRHGVAAAIVAAALTSAAAGAGQSPPGSRSRSDGSDPAWRRAAPGRPITLPADHASHPEYKLEWWYYTGNLDAADGRRFGYQLTFFRVGVVAAPANRSVWAVRDLFMTHLALTDVSGRRFLYSERLNRSGPGWAGAETDRYRVWNEDWQASADGNVHRLRAHGTAEGGERVPFGVELTLADDRPAVLHGDRGYSRKGADPGNASHYYSLTRMGTTGTIDVDGRRTAVTGLSWMDHEFGTSFLEAPQIGWDWLAIQLADGRSLMLYRFRRSDGAPDPRSSGTLVGAAGRFEPVAFDAGTLEPGRIWTSPASGARYPVAWSVHLPREGIELSVSAVLDNQELRTGESTGLTYWEGAVDVTGTDHGRPVGGRGYLEMTGYAGEAMRTLLR